MKSSTPAPVSPTVRLTYVVTLIIIVGLALGGSIAYLLLNKEETPTPLPITNTNTGVPTPTATTTSQLGSSDVTWTTPIKISSLHVFAPVKPPAQSSEYTYNPEDNARYYTVGAVKNGSYAGSNIILLIWSGEGPGGDMFSHLVQQNNKVTILDDHSDYFNETYKSTFDTVRVAVDHDTTLTELKPLDTINGPKPRQTLKLVPYSIRLFEPTGLHVAFTDAVAGPVYTNAAGVNPFPPQMGQSYNGFYIKMPDGTSYAYTLKPDFINDNNIPAITWNDGSKNTTAYDAADRTGCGSSNYAAVVSPADIDIVKDLVKVGVNSFGDTIYALKDTNHKLLKDMYNNTYQVYGEGQQKVSYDEFIKARPLLFWVDPFDRLIKLSNMTFQPMAECGKPVIYLYPPKTTNVSVQVKPEGGLSYSDPAYNNGWLVTAEPNGQLTNLTNGQTYPYLFWEGRGGLYQKPNEGWVIARSEVESFLRQQLKSQGLIDQEINDFLEFWLPRMQAKPYYFISFYGTRMMDQLAPLTIEPKPDTVIRLLMDFTPLDQPISVKPYAMPKPPARQGFTVIEWGGVIQ